MHTPKVSIGLPVYNGENFLADAIQCALAQTFTDWELIICDNQSTDSTMDICRDFAERDSRIRVYQNERNMGVAYSYNRVFSLSRGQYFRWATHDDLFEPEFIESCLEVLEADSDAVLVFPTICYVDAARRQLRRQGSELSVLGTTAEARARRFLALGAQGHDIYWALYGLIRREVLQQAPVIGLYSGSDQVMVLEIALRGNLRQIDRDLFFRREHPMASTLRRGWSLREKAQFVNADDKRRFLWPNCRLLKEYLNCVNSSSITGWGKVRCTIAVLHRFSAYWRLFVEEAICSPYEALLSVTKGSGRMLKGAAVRR